MTQEERIKWKKRNRLENKMKRILRKELSIIYGTDDLGEEGNVIIGISESVKKIMTLIDEFKY